MVVGAGGGDGGRRVCARVPFDGGYYLCYHCIDQDEEASAKLYQQAMAFIEESPIFELDERPNHYAMGHIITPKAVAERQGFSVMETFIPVKLT